MATGDRQVVQRRAIGEIVSQADVTTFDDTARASGTDRLREACLIRLIVAALRQLRGEQASAQLAKTGSPLRLGVTHR